MKSAVTLFISVAALLLATPPASLNPGSAAIAAKAETTTATKSFTPPAEALDRSADRVVEKAFIVSGDDRHGEVKFIKRQRAWVMQTLLHTKYLRRVVGKIRDKEAKNWPLDRPGHTDAARYQQALQEAVDIVEKRFRERSDRSDRFRKLLIEFVLTEDSGFVALFAPEVTVSADAYALTSTTPIQHLQVSRHYIAENLVEIGNDRLDWDAARGRALLERADSGNISVP